MTGMISDPKNVIELQTWWLGELKTITERLIREEEKPAGAGQEEDVRSAGRIQDQGRYPGRIRIRLHHGGQEGQTDGYVGPERERAL